MQAHDTCWPHAWYTLEDEPADRKAPNMKSPNEVVDSAILKRIGIAHWKFDPDDYTYPKLAVPWDPKSAVDPRLSQICEERGYSYADIITIHPDTLPDYESKVKAFYEEHIHDAEEVRYVLSGSGFFDVRDLDNRWIRIHVKKGDLMTLPEGLYHRFTLDEGNIIRLMRLFKGKPVWASFNRPCDENPSRKKYVTEFLQEMKQE